MNEQAMLLIDRLDQLLQLSTLDRRQVTELYMSALSIATLLYGPNSLQAEAVRNYGVDLTGYTISDRTRQLGAAYKGMLQCFRDEIQSGLVTSLQAEAKGEVLADFVAMAKQAVQDRIIEVAAVLACAALEDTLKRYAELHGLDVHDKDMSNVIGALQSKGLLKGPRGRILRSFVTIRNSALHASWEKIDSTEVQSVIAFVQEFLIVEFSGAVSRPSQVEEESAPS
jgi:hypothetical protein